MKGKTIYYANDKFGDLSLAVFYDPADPIGFCTTIMQCGVFASITPIGNVRVFTHRQTNRLLSGKTAVVTVASKSGKLLVQVYDIALFEKNFTISESLAGVVFKGVKPPNGEGQYFFMITENTVKNVFVSSITQSGINHNLSFSGGELVFKPLATDEKVFYIGSTIAPVGSTGVVTVDGNTAIFERSDKSLAQMVTNFNSETLVTMFLKMLSKSGPYGDIMRISPFDIDRLNNPYCKIGLEFVLENLGFRITTDGRKTIVYPFGNEEAATVVGRNDSLVFRMENKELYLSIINWEEPEEDK